MKKTILLFAILFSISIFSQTCGFDEVQHKLEVKFPEAKKNREAAEAKLLNMNVNSYLNKIGATSKAGKYTGAIYEIPVVIHIIESNDPANSSLSLTDNQIKTWLDNCNKMYATNFGNDFFSEGSGSLDGNVIPFKLVLAKRAPDCTASTGIVRANGSTLTGYDTNFVNSDNRNGARVEQIRTLSPHWPENSYFNIYIVLGFDGDKSTYGLMGWCGYPTNPDYAYESFMKVTVVTNNNDSTMAHEFGHGLGLKHVFDSANAQPGKYPSETDCPTNNDCTTDNDQVCDTAPTASLLSVNPTPNNSKINPCTGTFYEGVQYNIMNYTRSPRKFTAGQRDRAIAMFMLTRGNLTKSLGATDLATDPGAGSLVAAICSPSTVLNPGNYGMGPRKVTLGTIDNNSDGYSPSNPQFYIDYSTQNCRTKSVATEIPDNSESKLSVSITTNPQYVKAWIDYNNNGTFELNEFIGGSMTQVTKNTTYVINFTPPPTAVKDTYLRMRVIADNVNGTACQDLDYGQAEDYSVKIKSGLAVSDLPKLHGAIVYSKSENKLTLVNSSNNKGFGDYEVYDMSGKTVQKGNAKDDVILKRNLPKGTYIIKYQNTSQKFIN